MADRNSKAASYENFWKRTAGTPYYENDEWITPENVAWNPATGYATPAAYLAATRGLPEWATKYVTGIGSSADAYNYADQVDDAGFVLPKAFASQRGSGGSNFDLGWRYDGQNGDGNEQAFMQELQKQLGGQVVLPYDSAFTTYKNSEIPTTGLDFQGYLNKQYVNPKVKEIPGLGKFVVADAANSFDWGLGDRSSFFETLFGEILPAGLKMYGVLSGLGNLLPGDLVTSLGSGGAEFAGSSVIPGSAGSSVLSGLHELGSEIPAGLNVAPVSTGVEVYTPGMDPGSDLIFPEEFPDLDPYSPGYDPGSDIIDPDKTPLEPYDPGYDPGSDIINPDKKPLEPGSGVPKNLLTKALTSLGLSLTDSDTDLLGKLLGTGLGALGASKKEDATSDLYKTFLDMGAPYRASLASLEANPSSYYKSPEVQGALQQGSDTLAKSLSAKVGNPILNPTAMQEMQNYTTNGLLGQLNQRRNFLAAAGGLGTSQAANLGSQAAQANVGLYDVLGAGLRSVFGNQRDYAGELLDILHGKKP